MKPILVLQYRMTSSEQSLRVEHILSGLPAFQTPLFQPFSLTADLALALQPHFSAFGEEMEPGNSERAGQMCSW